ncbi:Nonaspanin (TM9SF), partial [Cynara cardunculus var. scolymus]
MTFLVLILLWFGISVPLTLFNGFVATKALYLKILPNFSRDSSIALYIFLYSINYLVFDLKSLSGAVSAMLYLGYSLFMVIVIMLATVVIGFLTSFFFIHRLFSSVKID